MSSQEFFVLNTIIFIVFCIWYWKTHKRQKQGPVSLNLRAKDSDTVVLPPDKAQLSQATSAPQEVKSVSPDFYKIRYANQGIPPAPKRGDEKDLNAIFNYNGHSWDAYEVFGVPAGAPLDVVTGAYQQLLKKSEKETHVFLETAYRTILSKVKF